MQLYGPLSGANRGHRGSGSAPAAHKYVEMLHALPAAWRSMLIAAARKLVTGRGSMRLRAPAPDADTTAAASQLPTSFLKLDPADALGLKLDDAEMDSVMNELNELLGCSGSSDFDGDSDLAYLGPQDLEAELAEKLLSRSSSAVEGEVDCLNDIMLPPSKTHMLRTQSDGGKGLSHMANPTHGLTARLGRAASDFGSFASSGTLLRGHSLSRSLSNDGGGMRAVSRPIPRPASRQVGSSDDACSAMQAPMPYRAAANVLCKFMRCTLD